MAVQTRLVTAEELERMPQHDKHVELVRGDVVEMAPAGGEHGQLALAIGSLLRAFVRQHKLGVTFGAETGFILSRNPDTVRAPDAAFVSTERAGRTKSKEGFIEGAPDLAVEVVSPGDTDNEVQEKVMEYLAAGTKMVLILRPRMKTITVHRTPTSIRVLTLEDSLDGEEVLPGLVVPLKEIFE